MNFLNYHHLRYFRAIAHEGSVTRAAKVLNLAQASLSIQLKKLEESFGQKLFAREGKSMVLTEAGRVTLDYAEVIFRTGDELLDVVKRRLPQQQRLVRVGAVATLSRNFQSSLLRPLFKEDGLGLILRSGTMSDLLTMLGSHLLDVVLSNLPARRDENYAWHSHLIDEQEISLVGRGFGKSSETFQFPHDLATIPVLLPGHDSNFRESFDVMMERHGIKPIIAAEVDDMAMLRLLAVEGAGLALVPRVVVREELQNGIVSEYYRFPDVRESFYAITMNRQFPNTFMKDLLDPYSPLR